ncbi:MAG: hypothetical protein HRU69_14690 [Flammeovirgaceae bacterium]|nr:MAG: hypothetical protein HRU69_14690 [Flammeovirgaceae bacterium]
MLQPYKACIRIITVTALLIFGDRKVHGQVVPDSQVLSAKHIQKIEKAESAKEKLKKYKKLYAQDSLKNRKAFERRWQLQADSLMHAWRENEDELGVLKQNMLISEYELLLDSGRVAAVTDSVNNEIAAHVRGRVNDSIQASAVRLTSYREHYRAYLKKDSLISIARKNLSNEVHSRFLNLKELKALDEITVFTRNDKPWKGYSDKARQVGDSAYIKDQARKMAEELATNYLVDHPEIIESVQKRLNVLMKKYAVVPNSNDLRTARKRASLTGKSFAERLYIAANFQVLSIKPVSIDFSPAIGYRFTTRWIAGMGLNYRKTFSNPLTPDFSADMWGYKSFVSFDVLSNFYLYTEFARNTTYRVASGEDGTKNWEQSLLLGVGRQVLIHPKIEMTIMVSYNFLFEPTDQFFVSPWSIRVGVQLSELALLKSKPYFQR